MSGSEIFILTMLGIGSGCLVNTGFMLQLVRAYWLRGQSNTRAAIFHALSIAIAFSCGMTPVFILLLIVMKSGWDWWRFAYFASVTLLTMAGSITAFHNVAKSLPNTKASSASK